MALLQGRHPAHVEICPAPLKGHRDIPFSVALQGQGRDQGRGGFTSGSPRVDGGAAPGKIRAHRDFAMCPEAREATHRGQCCAGVAGGVRRAGPARRGGHRAWRIFSVLPYVTSRAISICHLEKVDDVAGAAVD